MKNKTKIIATLGPASENIEKIKELISAGVNIFRLNFSHGTYEYHKQVLLHVREAARQMDVIVGVLQDISGPKIRIGDLEKNFSLKKNDTITFSAKNKLGIQKDHNSYEVGINYPHILTLLHVNDYIYLYDGIIRTKVIDCSDESVTVLVENDGMLSSKKGVNFPNTALGVDVLTKKDIEDMHWGVQNGVDFMAISFVQNAQDMLRARDILKKFGGEQMLIAKIEKFDAIENFDAILDVSDGVMVARGDLGIELPYYEVPRMQKMIIQKCNAAAKPVITATQMLLSMTHSTRATRAEISDIANAVLDGTDAVMLSEESAIGEYAPLAVETMLNTILEIEKAYPYYNFNYPHENDTTNALAESAVRLSQELEICAILSLTSSGLSAKKVAKYRSQKPIYAITHDDKITNQLMLSWGVIPLFSVEKSSFGQSLSQVIKIGLQNGALDLSKNYILTAGDPIGVSGCINMIRVLKQNEMHFFCNIDSN